MKKPGRILGWVAVGALALATTATGVTYAVAAAVSPGPGNTYAGCVDNKTGAVRILSTGSQCRKSESSITLQGPQVAQERSIDCAASSPESIQDVIDAAPVYLPLSISIQGTCTQPVNINRDHVSLGADPSSGDGITLDAGSTESAIAISGHDVNVNGLTLTGGANGIITFAGASIGVDQVTVDGAANGVWIGSGSVASLNHVTISGATQQGIFVMDGASASVFNSSVSDSDGGMVVSGGHVQMNQVTISGSAGFGVELQTGATANMNNVTVEDSGGTGVHSWNGSSANVGTGSLITGNGGGGVIAQGGGVANIQGAEVTANQHAGVMAIEGAQVTVQGGSSIHDNVGDGVNISGGSMVTFQQGNGRPGNVISNNTQHGVAVSDTSLGTFGAVGDDNTVSDNGQYGLFCAASPAVPMIAGVPGTLTGNNGGGAQSNCPGF